MRRPVVFAVIAAATLIEPITARPVSPNRPFSITIQAQTGSPVEEPTKLTGVLVYEQGSFSRFSAVRIGGEEWERTLSPKVRAVVVRADLPEGRGSAGAEILRPDENGKVVLSLKAPFEVSGEVLDLTGQPVEGAQVTAIVNTASYTGPLEGPSALSDSRGKFALKGLAAGLKWQALVEKPLIGMGYSDPVDGTSGEPLQIILMPTQAAPGKPAPELRHIAWAQGPATRLSDLRGKVALLDFWATWCGPCRMTMPRMEELHERYASRGLVVIGIHDSTATARQVIQFLKSRGVRYRVAVDTKVESQPTGSPTHDAYGVFSLPSLFLIDQQGIIRWTGHPLSPDIEQRLKFLLGG